MKEKDVIITYLELYEEDDTQFCGDYHTVKLEIVEFDPETETYSPIFNAEYGDYYHEKGAIRADAVIDFIKRFYHNKPGYNKDGVTVLKSKLCSNY